MACHSSVCIVCHLLRHSLSVHGMTLSSHSVTDSVPCYALHFLRAAHLFFSRISDWAPLVGWKKNVSPSSPWWPQCGFKAGASWLLFWHTTAVVYKCFQQPAFRLSNPYKKFIRYLFFLFLREFYTVSAVSLQHSSNITNHPLFIAVSVGNALRQQYNCLLLSWWLIA